MNTLDFSANVDLDAEKEELPQPSGTYAYFSGEQNYEKYEYIKTQGGDGLAALNGEGTIATWLYRETDESYDWRNVYDIPNSHLLEFVDGGGFDWRAENNSSDFFNINGPDVANERWQHITLRMSKNQSLSISDLEERNDLTDLIRISDGASITSGDVVAMESIDVMKKTHLRLLQPQIFMLLPAIMPMARCNRSVQPDHQQRYYRW